MSCGKGKRKTIAKEHKMKFFENVTNINEVKAIYRKLAMKFHPDHGGDTKIMQELNKEYDIMLKMFKFCDNHNTTKKEKKFTSNATKKEKRGPKTMWQNSLFEPWWA